MRDRDPRETAQLLRNLAHDLHQPLTAISNYVRGSVRLIERSGSPDAQILEALGAAAEATERASGILTLMQRHIRAMADPGGDGRRTGAAPPEDA